MAHACEDSIPPRPTVGFSTSTLRAMAATRPYETMLQRFPLGVDITTSLVVRLCEAQFQVRFAAFRGAIDKLAQDTDFEAALDIILNMDKAQIDRMAEQGAYIRARGWRWHDGGNFVYAIHFHAVRRCSFSWRTRSGCAAEIFIKMEAIMRKWPSLQTQTWIRKPHRRIHVFVGNIVEAIMSLGYNSREWEPLLRLMSDVIRPLRDIYQYLASEEFNLPPEWQLSPSDFGKIFLHVADWHIQDTQFSQDALVSMARRYRYTV